MADKETRVNESRFPSSDKNQVVTQKEENEQRIKRASSENGKD